MILGEGPERASLYRSACRLGIAGDLIMPGFNPNPWALMRRARVFVSSSISEGFGNVIVEAMIAGCPVVATPSGGPQDILRHGENGLFAEPDAEAICAAVLSLLEDDALREKMIAQARIDSAKFSSVEVCQQFCRLLDEVLHGICL